MAGLRQLPLFAPREAAEINRHTPLSATLPLFRRHLRREGKSDYTLRAFASDLRLLAEHTHADLAVGDFTTPRLLDFLDWLEHGREVPCSRKSWARRVTTLKVYFAWLRAIDAIAADPAAAIAQRSGPAPLAAVLDGGEVERALAAARLAGAAPRPDVRPALLLRLLLETGIKKGETVRLRREDFDRESEPPMLTLRYRGRAQPRGRNPEQQARNPWRERRIPLSQELLLLLDRWLEQSMSNEAGVFNCSARNLEYVLAGLARAAGLPRLSFEMLRWTCALRDWQAGMPPETLRDKLGLSESSWQQTREKLEQLAALQPARDGGGVQLPESRA